MRLGALADRGQELRLQRLVIGAGPPLGCGTGEDREVATAVVVLILDAPNTRSFPVFHEPNISVKVLLDCAVAVALVTFASRSAGSWAATTSSKVLG